MLTGVESYEVVFPSACAWWPHFKMAGKSKTGQRRVKTWTHYRTCRLYQVDDVPQKCVQHANYRAALKSTGGPQICVNRVPYQFMAGIYKVTYFIRQCPSTRSFSSPTVDPVISHGSLSARNIRCGCQHVSSFLFFFVLRLQINQLESDVVTIDTLYDDCFTVLYTQNVETKEVLWYIVYFQFSCSQTIEVRFQIQIVYCHTCLRHFSAEISGRVRVVRVKMRVVRVKVVRVRGLRWE